VQNGKYRSDFHRNSFAYKWPEAREKVVAKVLAGRWDVHICPYLLSGRDRAVGTSVNAARTYVHADVDLDGGHIDLEAVQAIPGGCAVASGTSGNAHVYVQLTEPVNLHHHGQLCKALGIHFGTKDGSKIRDNDLLRPPGTFNFKPTVASGGEGLPAPVHWLVRPTEERVAPSSLAELLGVELTDDDVKTLTADANSSGSPVDRDVEPVPLLQAASPTVHAALQRVTGDRSADTMRIVTACRANELTLPQTRWVIDQRADLTDRLDERHDDDVARCWQRAHDRAQEEAEYDGQTGQPDADAMEAEVQAEFRRMRVRAEARQRFENEKASVATPFDAGLLDDILARPAEPPYRIHRLMPADGSMLVVAQRKTGKTTLMLNLARSLVTGEPFLNRFSTVRARGRIAILNYEVSGAQLGRWAQEVGVPSDRLVLVNLRGRRDPLSYSDDRSRLAGYLKQHAVESLIVDPFGRAYSGDDQNSSGKVAAWLVGLDAFARNEVGARDLILTAHAGWNGERTRGSSALEDWADSIVTLTSGPGGDRDFRYLRAIGRDVSVDEDRLAFDPATKLLTMTGLGSRQEATHGAKVEALAVAVCDYLENHPGVSFSAIDKAVTGKQSDKRRAIDLAEQRGDLHRDVEGIGKATKHFRTHPIEAESARGRQDGVGDE
jgi:hypothetical protein